MLQMQTKSGSVAAVVVLPVLIENESLSTGIPTLELDGGLEVYHADGWVEVGSSPSRLQAHRYALRPQVPMSVAVSVLYDGFSLPPIAGMRYCWCCSSLAFEYEKIDFAATLCDDPGSGLKRAS